jgi:uncharacterized protein with GYD domain
MSRYLFKVSYTADGLRGVLKEGAQSRSDFVHKMAADMGGSVESFDFAFGDTDCYVVCEMDGDETAAAVALAVSASGAATVETVKLLTPAQVDAARGITTNYRAPGA